MLNYFFIPVTLIPLSISLKVVIFNFVSLNQFLTSFGVCLNANFGEYQSKFTPTLLSKLSDSSQKHFKKCQYTKRCTSYSPALTPKSGISLGILIFFFS